MNMETNHPETIKAAVRKAYGEVATGRTSGCCSTSSCYGTAETARPDIGYSEAELAGAPEGANLGLGCGNPQAIASLKPGERVLDLGSGAGFDAFLAARQVGPEGHVIGVDMTPEMIAKARANAAKAGIANVEFRLGEIEHLPVADASVDVIMSNCVINLSPDKPAVFREAFRVLAPGGRLAISDIVAIAPMPEPLQQDLSAYTGCIAGAALVSDVQSMLIAGGFQNVRVEVKGESRTLVSGWAPGTSAEEYVASALIQATKAVMPIQNVAADPGHTVADARPSDAAVEPACCDSTLLAVCCEPTEKAKCCDSTALPPGACGCVPEPTI
jgi:SAM-dependent methyltransferase